MREHWSWQGADVGQYRKMLYAYEDPRVDLQGRGFLGFGEVRVRDADRLSETTTSFDHAARSGTIYPYAGLPKVVTHVAPILKEPPPSLPAVVRARVTRTETSYNLKHVSAFKTHFVHPFEWTSDEWEQDVLLKPDGIDVPYHPPALYQRRRSGLFEYDDYGNRTKAVEATQGGVRRVLETPHEIRPDPWLISLPQATSYRAFQDGVPFIPEPRVAHYTHDSNGFLESVESEPLAVDPHQRLTTTFQRNDDGLVTLVTWEAPGEAPRHLSISYEETEGIFPDAAWNDLGFLEEFAYYPAYGLLSASRNINGVETRRQHDAFGRLRHVETDGEAGLDIGFGVDVVNGQVRGLIEYVQSDAGDASYTVLDALGRPIEEASRAFDGQWSRSAVAYDLLGRAASVTRPELQVISANRTKYRYDTLDRLLAVEAPDD
ncbi:MAG TPA: hypothetical protein VK459_14760, partial [Polyangiaceae bacterium]|nr:hypothetical protein [Polyangiaceae bacterium]